MSSLFLFVPIVLYAPTARTYGSYAGSERPRPFPGPEPVLPAAATTTIPCFHACSAAYASGSTPYGWLESVPYERLITRMFMPGSCACWTTQSIAAITWVTSAPPSAAATLSETIRASGAMPRYADAGALEYGAVSDGSCPAMSPAMNVPWPFVSRFVSFEFCDSSERSGP